MTGRAAGGRERASNILRIEEKKDGVTYHGKPHPDLYHPLKTPACGCD